MISILNASEELFGRYERERCHIDELCEIQRKSDPPRFGYFVNRSGSARNRIVCGVREFLKKHDTVGYHCTRLTAAEICQIRANGMVTLSPDHLVARVRSRIEAGEIPEALGRRLIDDHGAGIDARRGKLWFVAGKSSLKDESGLYRLFRHWGGEGVYVGHERDPELGPLLRTIGEPCIVAAALPLSRLTVNGDLGEHFYAAYMRTRGVRTEHAPEFEGYLGEPLSPHRIVDVIRYGDPRFEELTGASSWHDSIT